MKKTALLAGFILLLATACHKADTDAFGGHTDTTDNPVREYMLALADDLVAASLEELEAALQADPQDPLSQTLYVMQGDLLSGGRWTVRRECPLKGLVIQNVTKADGLMGWILEFDGDLSLIGSPYPTRFTLQAEHSPTQSSHSDWRITSFSGQRTERDGYMCTFDISSGLVFEALQDDKLWNAFGTIRMMVYKNDILVDTAYLSLKGSRSAAVFVHGPES